MNATFVSIWDGSNEIRTTCKFDPLTKDVTDIESSDVSGLDILFDEYVELPDGTEVRDFTIDGEERE